MRIKVIYNPASGRRVIQKNLEQIIGKLLMQETASTMDIHQTLGGNDAELAAQSIKPGQYDLLIGCGGDGTINQLVNGIIKGNSRIPLAILPAGTVNDFAYSLHLPTEVDRFCEMVKTFRLKQVDVGRANGNYFINVAAFGMFTDVAHTTSADFKSVLGKLAYYLQGVKEAQNIFSTFPVSMQSNEKNINGDFMLCLISNSQSVGNMRRLMSKAKVDDGLLDVLLLKRKQLLPQLRELADPANLLDKLLKGELENDPSLVYFQTAKVQFTMPAGQTTELDLDGEAYGHLPVTIEAMPRA
ncbi:MAG: diacylglycerol kinase family lipid kinase, partial [Clostridiales bacterium]